MDIRAIGMKPGLLKSSSFSNSTVAVGTVIDRFAVKPFCGACYKDTTSPVPNVQIFMTPSAVASYPFELWRGGMNYRIEFRCCKFVSTRLRIAWHPTTSETPTVGSTYTADQASDITSMVFDVMGDTIIEFNIPYLQDQMYMQRSRSTASSDLNNYQLNGWFTISAVNTIVVNTSGANDSTIWYNVYAASAGDMQYACPRSLDNGNGTNSWYRYFLVKVNNTIPTGTYSYSGNTEGLTTDQPDAHDLDLSFRKTFRPLVKASALVVRNVCSGEEIVSFKQLIQRFYQQNVPNIAFTTGGQTFTINKLQMYYRDDNPLAMLGAYFLYRKGSMMFKVLKDAVGSAGYVNHNLRVNLVNNYSGSVIPLSQYSVPSMNGTAMQYSEVVGGVEWREPYYHMNPFVPNTQQYTTFADEADYNTSVLTFIPVAPGNCNYSIWFAAGDDFAMALAMGCPVLYIGPTAPPT
jgi:hypothetical protein